MDWFATIWHKPLAAWTLADIAGIFATLVGFIVALYVVASLLFSWRVSSAAKDYERAADNHRKLRKKLGYDADDTL
jgi:hypothetical protein